MLKTLMERPLPQLREPHTPSAYINQTQRPTFPHNGQIFVYQNDLSLYYQTEKAYGRDYTEMEKTSDFLGEIPKDSRFAKGMDKARKDIPRGITEQVSSHYRLGSIADTIARHASVEKGVGADAYHGETPQIKTTHVTLKDDTEAQIKKTEGQEKKHPKCQPRPHVQCPACQQYLHNERCDFLAKLY